ncbi:glycosyltransferase family 25 protein [Stutzerimonas tarimensis]|uniref:Glycosyltransferase family 25 protein n=1 Tax=Stutzerimonas tarimensis TaxID=1507735 RepID=A0ABV7T4V7_9GAMM
MINSYLINLDKDADRLAFFQASFDRLGLTFERIPAVDGRLFPEAEYQAFMGERPRRHKSWQRGQMGCFLSHYAAWEKIAAGPDRFCAVFEDDVHLSDDLPRILADDRWIDDTVDIIRLETSTNRVRLSRKPALSAANREAFRVRSTTWCTGGYLINKRTAQALIDLPAHYHEPSDALLFSYDDSAIAADLVTLQFEPALCTQDKFSATGEVRFHSNIESRPSPLRRLKSKAGKLSPGALGRAFYRSFAGYRRIGFR